MQSHRIHARSMLNLSHVLAWKMSSQQQRFLWSSMQKNRGPIAHKLKARWSLLHVKCLTFVQVIAALVHHSEDSLESMVQTGYLHATRPTCFPVSDRAYRHNGRQYPL